MTKSTEFGCSQISWFLFVPITMVCALALLSTVFVFVSSIYRFYFASATISTKHIQNCVRQESRSRKVTANSPPFTPDACTPAIATPDIYINQDTPDHDQNVCNATKGSLRSKTNTNIQTRKKFSTHMKPQNNGVAEIDPVLKAACVLTLGIFCIHSMSMFVLFIIRAICPETVINYNYDAHEFNNNNTHMFVYHICQQIINWTYFLPLSLEFIIFSYRLIVAFDGTILEISKIKTRFLISVAILLLLIVPVFDTVSEIAFSDPNSKDLKIRWRVYGVGLWTTNYIVGFFVAVHIFNTQVQLCNVTLFSNCSQKQKALLKLSTKLLCCVSISCLSTILTGSFWAFVNMAVRHNNEGSTSNRTVLLMLFVDFAAQIDFSINSLCLVLQWPGFEKYYYICCKLCDNVAKLHEIQRKSMEHDMQFPSIDVLSSTATSSTASPGAHDEALRIYRTRRGTSSNYNIKMNDIGKFDAVSKGSVSKHIIGSIASTVEISQTVRATTTSANPSINSQMFNTVLFAQNTAHKHRSRTSTSAVKSNITFNDLIEPTHCQINTDEVQL